MRLTGVVRTAFLVALLVSAAGCGAATTAQSTAKPTVRIISPVNGAKLSSGRVTDRPCRTLELCTGARRKWSEGWNRTGLVLRQRPAEGGWAQRYRYLSPRS